MQAIYSILIFASLNSEAVGIQSKWNIDTHFEAQNLVTVIMPRLRLCAAIAFIFTIKLTSETTWKRVRSNNKHKIDEMKFLINLWIILKITYCCNGDAADRYGNLYVYVWLEFAEICWHSILYAFSLNEKFFFLLIYVSIMLRIW